MILGLHAQLLLASVLICVLVILMLRPRYTLAGARSLCMLMGANGYFALMAFFENISRDTLTKVMFARLAYPGIVSIAPLLLIFSLQYMQLGYMLTRRNKFLLWVVPLLGLLIVASDPWTGWLYTSVEENIPPLSNYPIYHHGTGFYLIIAYLNILIVASTYLLFRGALQFGGKQRAQMYMLLAALFFPWLGNILYVADIFPLRGVDPSPLTFSITGVLLAFGIFRFEFLNVVPIARERVFEDQNDALIVFDSQRYILDINPAALRFLSGTGQDVSTVAKKRLVGKPADEYLAHLPDLLAAIGKLDPTQMELETGTKENPRYFELRVFPLINRPDILIGHVASLHEITHRRKIQAAEREQRNIAEALRESAAALSGSLDFEEVLDRILDSAGRVVPHDAATIGLVDEEGQVTFVRDHGFEERGIGKEVRSSMFQIARTRNLKVMAKTGLPLVIPETSKDPEWVVLPGMEWQRSYAGAPIRVKDRLLGFINLTSTEAGYYGPDCAQLLQGFADQAAIAIENARLYREVQSALEEVEAIRSAGLALNSTLDFKKLMETIFEQLSRALSFDCATVQGFEGDESVVLAGTGFNDVESIIGIRYPNYPNLLVEKIFDTRQPIRIQNVREAYPEKFEGHLEKVQSWMGVPLIYQDEIIGLLTFDSYQPAHFSLRDEQVAQAFGAHVAVALENARLYMETQRRLVEQSALNQIIRSVSSKLGLRELLEIVDQQISQFIPARHFVIVSYNVEEQQWRVIYEKGFETRLSNRNFSLEEGVIGYVIQNPKPLLFNNPRNLEKFLVQNDRKILVGKPNSMMISPLMVGNNLIGVMGVYSFPPAKSYSEADFILFNTIAGQVSVALENARLYAQMEQLATTDTLTGLYNRHHFFLDAEKEFARALRYEKPLSLAMMDIDNFKQVNDTYGHIAGDIVLQQISQTCRSSLRKIDVIGRYGGEEFVILLPETPGRQAYRGITRLRQKIADSVTYTPQGAIQVTVSIGVATLETGAGDITALVDAADKALYKAKNSGRNRVVLYDKPI